MIKEIADHRSIRSFSSEPIAEQVLEEILLAATRASNTGNMQLYSIVVTTDESIKKELAPCHFNQPMVTAAPVVMTFCADINRFSKWCKERDAEPQYDNFMWFISATVDAMLASQNASLEAEAHGLGICYLGTTLYSGDKISEILHLPNGVVPIMTVVMGYPSDTSPLTDRLPLRAVVHREKYNDYDRATIDDLWRECEASELTARLLQQNGEQTLAQVFTRHRYKGEDNVAMSRTLLAHIKAKGFFNQ